MKVVFFMLMLWCVPVLSFADQADNDVKAFWATLERGDTSLETYQKFVSQGEGVEFLFELQTCRKRGWAVSSPECVAFTQKRAQNPKAAESLYLKSLRNRLGKLSRVVIKSRVTVERYVVVVDGKQVILEYICDEQNPGFMEKIGIKSVDGVDEGALVKALTEGYRY